MARVFAWLRPNDLVWNYWVNNYLMGNDQPAFDVLYWNSDSTRLPARLHGELLEIFMDNPFRKAGRMDVLGAKVDVSRIASDAYIVAGMAHHITPWKGCYAATQMLGGKHEFVLSSSGHVQSVVNPPGNPKARFFTNPESPPDPDEWLARAQSRSGSWWEHWRAWMVERSGPLRPAPNELGNRRHPAREPAPGVYVLES